MANKVQTIPEQVWDFIDKFFDLIGISLPNAISYADFERSVEATSETDSLVCSFSTRYYSFFSTENRRL
jgi:hypothetical protein